MLNLLSVVEATMFEKSIIRTRLREERRIFGIEVLLLARSGQEVCIASCLNLRLLLNDGLLFLLCSCSLKEPDCIVADAALPIDLVLIYISAVLRRLPRN